MELTYRLFWFLKNENDFFEINMFVPCILKIHVFYLESDS